VPNLFVTDGSIFPAGCGVNPQLTIMALASLAADEIQRFLG
jgi:choline dehydrogenase-like flavoprotein